jgi:hypothetical protein
MFVLIEYAVDEVVRMIAGIQMGMMLFPTRNKKRIFFMTFVQIL